MKAGDPGRRRRRATDERNRCGYAIEEDQAVEGRRHRRPDTGQRQGERPGVGGARRDRLLSWSSANRIPTCGALVVTGEGPVFSAGLNVSEVLDNEKGRTECAPGRTECGARPVSSGSRSRRVAAINGSAIAGGCILACACDKRLIADEAPDRGHRAPGGRLVPRLGRRAPEARLRGPVAEPLMLDAALLDAEEARRLRPGAPEPAAGRPGCAAADRRRRAAGVTRRPRLRIGEGIVETGRCSRAIEEDE